MTTTIFIPKSERRNAFEQVKCSEQIKYPLFGYTSENNEKAIKLLEKLGFEKEGEIGFMGEPSILYIKKTR
jgi:hypothetical protein